ncbi:MAG: hypothetical protein ACI8XB_000252 [Patiriisocius sp.]|jgi:hypothetical protein
MKNITLLLSLLFSVLGYAQLTVNSISPESQTLTATINQAIEITFSEEISPFTFGENNFQVFGRWSGPMQGSLDFNGDFTAITFTPDGEFIAGEMVTVNLSKFVTTPNAVPLTNGYAFSFWIKSESTGMDMIQIQEIEMKLDGETFIQCYGAYAGDINDDGFSDLSVINEFANDVRVLLNDGEGTYTDFEIYPLPSGNKPSPNEGADFNHDGFIDLAISHVQSNVVSVLMGDGEGGFLPEVGYTVGQGVRGLATIDLEADGHADIVTANRNASSISLLSNDGTGLFGDINSIPGISDGETAMAIADANEDGIMDLFVGAYSGGEVFIMLNDGEGNFTAGGSAPVDGQVWMVTIGDVNLDGHVDLVSANSNGHNCSVHLGDGLGGFSDSYDYPTGNFPLAIDLGDLDGDGDLDMITSNYSGINYTLFENDGTGNFINPTSFPAEAAGSCAIFHDRDNDGTLDLTLIDELEDLVFLYIHDPLSIEEYKGEVAMLQPNPFKDEITITIDGSHDGLMSIYSIDGNLVKIISPRIENTQTKYYWNADKSIASGTYIFDIENLKLEKNKIIKE